MGSHFFMLYMDTDFVTRVVRSVDRQHGPIALRIILNFGTSQRQEPEVICGIHLWTIEGVGC